MQVKQNKYEKYEQLAADTLRQLTASRDNWLNYLDTASRMYKYSFDEQLLIHAQRPDTKACAEFSLWAAPNGMNRHIKRKTKSIVLINRDTKSIRHVYAVEDTEPRANGQSKDPEAYIWQLAPEKRSVVNDMILRGQSVKSDSLEQTIVSMSYTMAQLQANKRSDEFDTIFDELELTVPREQFRAMFTELIAASAAYTAAKRAGTDVSEYLPKSAFANLPLFGNARFSALLGSVTAATAEPVIARIERTVKELNALERSADYGEQESLRGNTEAHSRERDSVHVRPDNADLSRVRGRGERGGASDDRSLRSNEGAVPQGELRSDVQQTASSESANTTSASDRRTGVGNGAEDSQGVDSSGRDGRGAESDRPAQMGRTDEQLQDVSTGNNNQGTDRDRRGESLSSSDEAEVITSAFSLPEHTNADEAIHNAFSELSLNHSFSDKQAKFLERLEGFAVKHSVTENLVDSAFAMFPAYRNTYVSKEHLSKNVFARRLSAIERELEEAIQRNLTTELPQTVKTGSQALYSIEQNGERAFYKLADGVTADDVLAAVRSGEALDESISRVSEVEYAEIQQSADFTFSVDINLDDNTASVYSVNDGKGGLSEGDRDDDSILIKEMQLIEENVVDIPQQEEGPAVEQQPDSLIFHFGSGADDKWVSESNIVAEFAESNPDCSFALGNAVFEYLDEKQHTERLNEELHVGWYHKTDFTLNGYINGEDFHYEGRFDIGDGKGTGGGSLIDHIRDYYRGAIEFGHRNMFPYNKPENMERAQEILDVFVPFLEAHSELTHDEQVILNSLKAEYPIRTQIEEQSEEQPQTEQRIDIVSDSSEDNSISSPSEDSFTVYELFMDGKEVARFSSNDKFECEVYVSHHQYDNSIIRSGSSLIIRDSNGILINPLERAKKLINDFSESEYDEEADFSDISNIPIAFTTDEKNNLPIKVSVDLENLRIIYEYDGEVFNTEQYDNIEDMIKNGLTGLDFSDLIYVPDEVIERHTKQETAADSEQSIAPMSDSFEGEVISSPSEVSGDVAYEMWEDGFTVYADGEKIPSPSVISVNRYNEDNANRVELFRENHTFTVSSEDWQQFGKLQYICTRLDNICESNEEINIVDYASDEDFGEPFDWNTGQNAYLNVEQAFLEGKTDFIEAYLDDVTREIPFFDTEDTAALKDDIKAYINGFSESAEAVQAAENADNAVIKETAAATSSIIQPVTIEKYGITLDFNEIQSVELEEIREEYLGGIDSDGHERKDNFGSKTVGVSLFDDYGTGFIRRADIIDGGVLGDFPVTVDEAAGEIEEFLDKAAADYNYTAYVVNKDGSRTVLNASVQISETADVVSEKQQTTEDVAIIEDSNSEKLTTTVKGNDLNIGDKVMWEGNPYEIESKGGLLGMKPLFETSVSIVSPSIIWRDKDFEVYEFAEQQLSFEDETAEQPSTSLPAESAANEATPQTAEKVDTTDFIITDDKLGEGGAKTKFRANVEAIRTLKAIEAENRPATAEEQQVLSQYVGWGGLKNAFEDFHDDWKSEYNELKELLTADEYAAASGSVLNAHYTSPLVIDG